VGGETRGELGKTGVIHYCGNNITLHDGLDSLQKKYDENEYLVVTGEKYS
jgi:hypothetical protein